MKVPVSFLMFVFFLDTVWAACTLTSHTLKKGGNPTYDEYLYPDGSYSEMRQEGDVVRAYLCGYNACEIGDIVRLNNAAIGGGATNPDSVYKCEKSVGGRDNYHWIGTVIESVCTANKDKFKYDNKLNLWVYGNKYCVEIDEVNQISQVFEIDNRTIVNNITPNYDVDVTEVYNVTVKKINVQKKLDKEDLEKIKSLVNKTENEIREDLKRQGIQLQELTKNVQELERLINEIENSVEINLSDVKNSLGTIETEQKAIEILIEKLEKSGLSKNAMGQVKGLIKDTVNKFNINMDALAGHISSLERSAEQFDSRLNKLVDDVERVAEDKKQQLKSIKKEVKNQKNTTKQLERLIEEVQRAGLNNQQMKEVKDLISVAVREMRADVNLIEGRLIQLEGRFDELNQRLWIQELINDFENNRQDAEIKKLAERLKSVKSQVSEKMDEGQVMDLILSEIKKSKLNQNQLSTVKAMVKKSAQKASARMNVIEKKLIQLEGRFDELNQRLWIQELINDFENNRQDAEIKKLAERLKSVKSQVSEKMDEGQVMDLILSEIKKSKLNQNQLSTVKAMVKKSAQKASARMDVIEKKLIEIDFRLGQVEVDVAGLRSMVESLSWTTDFRFLDAIENDAQLHRAIVKLDNNLKDVASKLDSKITVQDAHDMIQAAVDNSMMELDGTISKVIDSVYSIIIDEMNQKISGVVGKIENRLNQMEKDIKQLQDKSDRLVRDVGALSGLTTEQIALLQKQVSTKTSATEVVTLITENTRSLRDEVKQQIAKLVVEYAKNFTSMQRLEIEVIVEGYIAAKIARIDDDLQKMREQNDAREKINSAMSVLNSFAAGAKVSVWKNKEGNFNTARLASDAVAGVVLGTAGGLISNHIIKKNQVKGGLEDIRCVVGGQVVADYGDEFMVGMQ